MGSTVYRGVLISEGWTRVGSTVYRRVLISEGYTRVGSTVYRGVLISEGWTRGAPLYTGMSSFQRVGLEGLHCIQGCPHFRGLD